MSADHSQRARYAALVRHSRTDGREATLPARKGWEARFARLVDPDGTLPPAERDRRAEIAKRAHMLGLARKSAKARRKGAA